MEMFAFVEDLGAVRKDIRGIPGLVQSRPARRTAVARFGQRVRHAGALLVQEPEILGFALLQWICVMLVYALWMWAVNEMPGEFGFFLSTAVCLVLVGLPVGFFTACIGAVHFLRRAGEPSSIPACIRLVAPRVWALWAFSAMDVGFTAYQVLDRMPSKRSRSAAERALSEALYYAWKLATIGILPAILAGRPLRKAAEESADLVRKRLADAALLRIGYSSVCWILGIAVYATTLVAVNVYGLSTPDSFGYYLWLVGPIVVALAFILLFARPVYVIASCELYHDYRGHPAMPHGEPRPASASRAPLAAGGGMETLGQSTALRVAAVALVALGAWAAIELGGLRATADGARDATLPIVELEGVRLGQSLAEVVERRGAFDPEPGPAGPQAAGDTFYLERGGRVRLAVRDGLVRGISYQCREWTDWSKLAGVTCHDSAEHIAATFGERMRTLCAKVSREDPRRARAPAMRALDVVDAGVRYVVQEGRVAGLIVRAPHELRDQVGQLWHPCGSP
jgi:hypothetical protein